MPHNVDHGVMFDGVKGFGKIKFKQNYWPFGSLALLDVLESPCEAVLYRSPMNETILVAVNNSQNNLLQAVGHELSNEFKAAVE